jgi:hypothetical protein
MHSKVKASGIFPSESSYRHGPPLLGWVRLCSAVPQRRRSYAALRLPCGIGRGSGLPSPLAYPETNAFLNRPHLRSWTCGAPETWDWVLRCPSSARGPSGVSQVTGSSSSHAPRPSTPPVTATPRPIAVSLRAAFGVTQPLGGPGGKYFGADARGSRARLPTHPPPRYREEWQGWLPACRAGLWPGGIRTRWMTNGIS